MWITPSKNVPVVTTTDFALIFSCPSTSTPSTSFVFSFRKMFVASPSITVRFSVFCVLFTMYFLYSSLSACALGERTAGPFLVFNILYWRPVWSIAFPISPPKASISLTTIPLAIPPMAGLHGIRPTFSLSRVIRAVFAPSFALARAASIPAWPPPITTTSNSLS